MANSSLAYCSKVDKLTPFQNKADALAWLDKHDIDLSNTPILLPFYNKSGSIELLKPNNEDGSLSVIGAGNPAWKANFLVRLYRYSMSLFRDMNFTSYMNDIDGDIPIEKNGFIVVYQEDKTSLRLGYGIENKFIALYENEKKDLIEQIKTTETNDKPKINESKFTENLSKLALDLNIVAGMCYFIYKEEDGTESVYRHTFKEGVSNRQIADYLAKEKESAKNGEKIAAPVQIQNNKTIRTHRIAFIKDLLINLSFLLITTAIMAATAAAAVTFLPLTPALIVIGITGVSLFAGIPSIYRKVKAKNQPTVEFGDKFETTLLSKYFSLNKGSFLSRIFSKLFSLFSFAKKNTPIVRIGAEQPEIESTSQHATTQTPTVEVITPANYHTNPAVADVARTESTAIPLTRQSTSEAHTAANNNTNPAVTDVTRYTNGALTRSIFASGILTRAAFAHHIRTPNTFVPFYYNRFATTLLSKYFTLGKESLLSRIFYSPFAFARKDTPALLAQPSNDETNTPAKNETIPVADNVTGYTSNTFSPLYNAAESIVSSVTAPLYAATGSFSKGITAATSYFFSKPANQPGTENTPARDHGLSTEHALPTPSAQR